MSIPLLVRRSGAFIELGLNRDGQLGPLPVELENLLAPGLTYQHRRFLKPSEQYGPDGSRRRIEFTNKRLYDISPNRTMITGFGCLPRLLGELSRAGCVVQIIDCTPPSKRPDAYIPDWKNFERAVERLKWTWRHRQLECIYNLANAYGGIINAPPAFGKTEIVAWLGILFPKARIAIVTRRADVAKTIARRLKGYLPDVGFVGGGKKPKGTRVTVYIAKSMMKADPDVDFCFFDEAHEVCSDWYAEQFVRTFYQSRNFGFTATPDGRADGASPRLEYMFGPELFYMSWTEATAVGLIVPVQVRWLNIVMQNNPTSGYTSDTAKKRWSLWRNDIRNAAFATALRLHGPEEQALCLVETIDHAVHLGQYLPDYQLCYDKMDPEFLAFAKTRGLLHEDYVPLSGADRDRLRNAFEDGTVKKVIATDVWSTGVSFNALGVLARLCGRSSEILDDQAPGRVIRIHEGKESAVMYDGWDVWDSGAKRRSQERYRRYASKGWQQVRDNILDSEAISGVA